jgi:DNA-binding NarL/FixJ family response regulator
MKTLLVDDHTLFREGLAMLIAHGFPEVRLIQAGDVAEALSLIRSEGDIELVLLDLTLPDSAHMEGLLRVREQAPDVAVVVLSADEAPETVLASIDAGAAGFVPKTAKAGIMQAALRVVLAGGVYLPTSVLGHSRTEAPARPKAPEPASASDEIADATGLSPRQVDVLRLLVAGKPNKLICRELDLAESTVKTHLAAIFRKLEVTSRTQAVVAAARMGLNFGPPGHEPR